MFIKPKAFVSTVGFWQNAMLYQHIKFPFFNYLKLTKGLLQKKSLTLVLIVQQLSNLYT